MITISVDGPDRGSTESLDSGEERDRETNSQLWLGQSTSGRVGYFLASGLSRTEYGLGRTEQTEIPSLETSQPDFGRLFPLVGLPFEIPDPGSVASYLRQHTEAKNALRRTYRALRAIFFDEPLRLEVYRDPEGEKGPELAIYIETSEAPEEALSKIDEFDEAFWLDHLEEFSSYLSVNLDYQ